MDILENTCILKTQDVVWILSSEKYDSFIDEQPVKREYSPHPHFCEEKRTSISN